MSLLSSVFRKSLSVLLSIAFIAESVFIPVASLLPQTARAETVAQAQDYIAVFAQPSGANVTTGATIPVNATTAGTTHGTLIVSGGTVHNAVVTLALPSGFVSPTVVDYRIGATCDSATMVQQPQPWPNLASPWNVGDIPPGCYFLAVNFNTTSSAQAGNVVWTVNGTNMTQSPALAQQSVNVSGAKETAQSITISRSPATSPTSPYKVGDATVSSSVNSPTLFTTNYTGTGYNQIGTNAPRTFTFSTLDLVNNGSCSASTGTCSIPGNWSATDFVCPSGVTGVQQMTEWYVVNNVTSNKLIWYFQCSATNVTNAYTPVGSLSGIDASGTATGWAADPDSSSTPITVHFYVDGAAGQGGTYAGSAVANLANASANSAGYAGNHGYSFSIPSQWRDGKPHTLYVHGIDLSGDGSKNVLLSNVPKSFTLGTAAASGVPDVSLSSSSFVVGTPLTVSVSSATANATVKVFCRDPNGANCDDSASYTTNSSGQFSHTYDTTGWTLGAYRGWVTVGGAQSDTVNFTVKSSTAALTVPETTLSSYDFPAGTKLVVNVVGVPGGSVSTFCIDPNGVQCQDTNAGTTDTSGAFSKGYDTTGWTVGSYTGWATVNGVKSNVVDYVVRAAAATTTPPVNPTGNGSTPTPQTAPMATLTLQRDQEQVLTDQTLSFSGTLDNGVLNAAGYAFPQSSSIFFTIPEKIAIDSISVDGAALGASDFSQSGQAVKIPLKSSWYSGTHPFKIVLRNPVSIVAQLDRLVPVWITVLDANGTLLLKGKTAAAYIRHLPTEVIGTGIMPTYTLGNPYADEPSDKVHWTGFENIQITRGPFYRNDIPYQTTETVTSYPNDVQTYSQVVHNQNGLLKYSNISNTLISGDMAQPIPLAKFSDSLAQEFITAYYQYLLGRDPSSDEVSRYLPLFTNWQNPLVNLWSVYQRRSDLQARFKTAGGGVDLQGLVKWAITDGWNDTQDGALLKAFKLQTGYDSAFSALKMAAGLSATSNTIVMNDVASCYNDSSTLDHCLNDPMARHQLILWAKDIGWATNFDLGCHRGEKCENDWKNMLTAAGVPLSELTYDNHGGQDWMYARLLKPFFTPGTYPEYQDERNLRYPPATLYYEIISSPEYGASLQNRFKANVDSLFRLYYNRPATQSDIDWAKGVLTKKWTGSWQWMNDNWEPNGLVVNCSPSQDGKTCTNPDYSSSSTGYAEDYVYGIRDIQAEVDVMSARLIEKFDNRNDADRTRVVTGLYRLYLRRFPTQSEIDSLNSKGFGDIELFLNQSAEYGKQPASEAAIKNMYRNYLLRDPSAAEIASLAGKSISDISQKIGKGQEVRDLAAKHPENAYVFPIKRIKFSSCGFFCSVLGKVVSIALAVAVVYALPELSFTILGSKIAIFGTIQAAIGTAVTSSLWQSFDVTQRIFSSSVSNSFNQSGFNGETFIDGISVGKSVIGMAGGVYNPMNLLENADPTILESFRTMALAPSASGSGLAQASQPYLGLASPLGAFAGIFGGESASGGRIAQIDVSGHYGSGAITQSSSAAKSSKATIAKASFTKTLKQGSRGADVLKLQKLLGAMDISFSPEYQTGYYGAKTVAAVRRFQKRNGLEQTGFVGAQTRALLNSIAK